MGLLDGAIETTAGWIGDEEVVEVLFDPRVVPYAELVTYARKFDCATHVFTRDDTQHALAKGLVGNAAVRTDELVRRADDTKYYLRQSPLRHVPLTPLQAARANAVVSQGAPRALLSPSQLAFFAAIEARPDAGWPVAIDVDFATAWRAAAAVASKATRRTSPQPTP